MSFFPIFYCLSQLRRNVHKIIDKAQVSGTPENCLPVRRGKKKTWIVSLLDRQNSTCMIENYIMIIKRSLSIRRDVSGVTGIYENTDVLVCIYGHVASVVMVCLCMSCMYKQSL